MKPGDKVIYTHTGGLEDGRPRIGFLVSRLDSHPVSAIGATVDVAEMDCEIIHNARIHPYSESLWSAWRRWLENDEKVSEQHKQLLAGKVPAELLTTEMWGTHEAR